MEFQIKYQDLNDNTKNKNAIWKDLMHQFLTSDQNIQTKSLQNNFDIYMQILYYRIQY
jgi:hypothetical protein